MHSIEQKFCKEIEVEQLWAVTEHGRYVFSTMLLVSSILVFGLWIVSVITNFCFGYRY
ncbi:MAG: hypothetical protein IPN42_14000 [Methylococcaceae bacterium]|nr:hypothetical protein [Methylococcaceae bacterium]